MFGLTKREQRWAAEQKAVETIFGFAMQVVAAEVASDTKAFKNVVTERDELLEMNEQLRNQNTSHQAMCAEYEKSAAPQPPSAAALGCAMHSCSYFCELPACIKQQRDEFRDKLASADMQPLSDAHKRALSRMDIYSPQGTAVIFDAGGGYDWEKAEAMEVLKLGNRYILQNADVRDSSTRVKLAGIDGTFNSCMFAIGNITKAAP